MILVKTYLDDEAHFFLTELLQNYNLYLLIMNVTRKMFGQESWKSKNRNDRHFDSHLSLWPNFMNLPINNGINEPF